MIQANLKPTSEGWEFASEADLEDFLWAALPQLLNLQPFKRQYWLPGQYHDILALDGDQLVVLELKNGEDRYVTYQITRYYDSLKKTQPFSDLINYEKPIRPIIVAPSFHEDNYILRQYSSFNIKFYQFFIITRGQRTFFRLTDGDSWESQEVEMAIQNLEAEVVEVALPSRKFVNLISSAGEIEKQGMRWVREYLLKSNPRFKEITVGGSVIIGSGKTTPCAEISYDRVRESIALFLWLPLRIKNKNKESVRRTHLWVNWQEMIVTDLAAVKKGAAKQVTYDEFVEATVPPRRRVNFSYAISFDSEARGYYKSEDFDRDYANRDWRLEVAQYQINQEYVWGSSDYQHFFAMNALQYRNSVKYELSDFSVETFLQVAIKTWCDRH